MNEYLVRQLDQYKSSSINCGMAGCFPEKLRLCLIEQVCHGDKCSVLSNPEDWILGYIRTCRYLFTFRVRIDISDLDKVPFLIILNVE